LDTLSWPEEPAAGDAGTIASCAQQECRRGDLPEQNERRMETKGKGTRETRKNVSALFRWRTLVTRLTVVIVVKGGGKGRKNWKEKSSL
jgi:ABC-type phosphate/phosphonate transport system ATPase subunit